MSALVELLGTCPGMMAVRTAVSRLLEQRSEARRLPPVLIRGETGTGKGLLARALHRAGPRAAGPFVDVNCAAIPDTLLEAEMFGVERGAFTDARETKPGLFRTAHRGTLFLDEIGLLPTALQVKLLSAIEDQRVRRLGATRSEPIDVWIVAATNEDLSAAIAAGRFREDFYHRLSVIALTLPPLRERGDDVIQLANHFLTGACSEYGLPGKVLTPDACAALSAHTWPGNVRELANAMERVALLSDSRSITADMLGLPMPVSEETISTDLPLRAAVRQVEREHLLRVLRETRWNLSRTAARLGIARNTLRQRIFTLDLRPRHEEAPVRRARVRDAAATQPSPSPPVERVAPPPPSIRWERRRLTFLYAVLTAASDETALVEPSRTLDACVQKVERFAGRIEGVTQGSVLAVFGLEDPLEGAADRAALTAMALQKVAQGGGGDRRADRRSIRVAIHTSPFLFGRIGDGTKLEAGAKRDARRTLELLIARAPAGVTVMSAASARLLERRFDLEALAVTGDGEPTYRLVGREHVGFGRHVSRFVGRREELELLRSRLEASLRGKGQVVGIGGAAGMGKSRLLFEFRRAFADRQVNFLESRCASYGSGIPYLPVVELLRAGFRVSEGDPPMTVSRKVRFGLRHLGLDPENTAPHVLRLLGVMEGEREISGLSPEAIKVRTLQVLRRMSILSSRRRPLVVVVEDIQWIDSASAAFLAALVEGVIGHRILVVVTCRPGYAFPWAQKSYGTYLSLPALDTAGSRQVLQSSGPAGGIPEKVERTIFAKAEGNPFFLEEFARNVSGEQPQGEIRIPDTIEEVLLARLDRLPGHLRQLLQAAAVFGREVSPRILGAMCEASEGLEDHLGELARLEFIHEAGATGDPLYAFTHALMREVALQRLRKTPGVCLTEVTHPPVRAIEEG